MKKNLKIFVVGYLVFLALSVVSCICDVESTAYSIKSFDWNIDKVVSLENHYKYEQFEDDELNFDNYAISIYPEEEYYTSNFTLLNKVYACDKPAPHTNDNITNIEIIVNNNFDDSHLAESEVTDLFKVSEPYSLELLTVPNFLSERNIPRVVHLLLTEAPLESGEYSFTVKITLEGRTLNYYEFTTNSVTITNN